jgi:UbiD family decarboxylase
VKFDAVGGIKGEPVEVIEGEITGLPIPAYAEIAVEAEILPDQGKEEGPFSEWTDYYASGEKTEPIKVHRLYHRNDPIITASPEYRPTARAEHCYELLRAAYIRDQVEKAGVPDVKGVASYFRRFLTVISIKQRYPGHARQAVLVASQMPGRRLSAAGRTRSMRPRSFAGAGAARWTPSFRKTGRVSARA